MNSKNVADVQTRSHLEQMDAMNGVKDSVKGLGKGIDKVEKSSNANSMIIGQLGNIISSNSKNSTNNVSNGGSSSGSSNSELMRNLLTGQMSQYG